MYTYYKLTSGELISKESVDRALALLAKLRELNTVVELSETELFAHGDKLQAIRAFKDKHDCSLVEAKTAIEHLRGE